MPVQISMPTCSFTSSSLLWQALQLYNHTGNSNSACFRWYSNFYLQLLEEEKGIIVLRHGAAVRWVKNMDCSCAVRIQSCFYQRLEFTCARSPPERSIFISPKHKPNLYSNSASENGFALSCGCASSMKEYSTLASALVLCLLLACFCWSLQKHSYFL